MIDKPQKKSYHDWTKDELIAEIERLKKRKKYGLVWEEKTENVVEECKNKLPVLKETENREIITDNAKPVNLLIEGDNYHALSVLNYTHEKAIDVIYIDPPYNTGAKDWKYNNDYVDINDAYRHSKWLSMMTHRLRLAKNLLKEDGVLICAIDENECAHLGVLLEELFPDREIHCITIVHNPRGVQGNNFSYTHEYAYFVFRKGLKVIEHRKIKKEDIDWRNLRDNGGESLRTDARNCFYPIIVEEDKIVGFGDVLQNNTHPTKQTVLKGGRYYVYPIDRQGVERKWRYARQSVKSIKDLLKAKKIREGYEIEIGKDFGSVRTVWQDSKYDANEYGTKLVHELVSDTSFDFPKSIFNTYDCIAPILYERKNALTLDFFAGSGTTGHAVLELNKEDGGNRQFILCTNNENNICSDVCYPRIKKVITGYKDLKGRKVDGLGGNLKYFATSFVEATATDKNKKRLTEQSTEMLCVRENTFEKVLERKELKIFKNQSHYTGIVFDHLAIDKFKQEIKGFKRPIHAYIFSLGDEDFSSEFEEMKEKITVCPIPEAILRVYRRIFK